MDARPPHLCAERSPVRIHAICAQKRDDQRMQANAMNRATITVSFMRSGVYLGLMARNDLFREAVAKFEARPAVYLLKEGFAPLPLAEASNDDVVFADALQITGTLLATSKLAVP